LDHFSGEKNDRSVFEGGKKGHETLLKKQAQTKKHPCNPKKGEHRRAGRHLRLTQRTGRGLKGQKKHSWKNETKLPNTKPGSDWGRKRGHKEENRESWWGGAYQERQHTKPHKCLSTAPSMMTKGMRAKVSPIPS